MQLFKLNAKRQKFLTGLLLITFAATLAYGTLSIKNYMLPKAIKDETKIIIKGEKIEEKFAEPQVKKNGIYFDEVVNYQYNAGNSISDVGYYIYFPITDLSPLTQYKIELSFMLKENLEDIGSVLVLATNIEPDFKYTPALQSYSTNIGNTKENNSVLYKIVKGDSMYEATLQFESNYEGNAWIIIGQEKPKANSFNFDVSDITYKIEGVKIDNQLDQE